LSDELLTEKILPMSFKLAGFIIDVSRGEIKNDDITHQIEPKVMAVLLLLVKGNGSVISQEFIFKQVWPGSIFSSSSIQRCIAILRKTFNDDAKRQHIIVTHPKRGYSLLAKLETLGQFNKLDSAQDNNTRKLTSISNTLLTFNKKYILVIIIAIFILLWKMIFPREISPFIIKQMQPLTATEHNEYFSRYSPDNRFIAFIREEDNQNKKQSIWLKSLTTDQETKLTDNLSHILSFTWSTESNALLYVSRQNNEISIKRLSLDKKRQPTNTIEIFKQKHLEKIRSIHWSSDNNLYYLANIDQQTHLFINNLTTGEEKSILTGNNTFKPYALSLSKNEQQLAVIGFNQNIDSVVKIITLKNNKAETISVLQSNVYAVDWHPNNDSLLISDGRELSQMYLNGALTKINFENFSYILYPSYNYKGNAITLTLENTDSDILLSTLSSPNLSEKIINSNTIDFAPTLSPDASKFVFISERKGYPQLFIYDLHTKKTQLIYKNINKKLMLAPPIWHTTKNIIASAINDKLIMIELNNDNVTITETENTPGIPQQWYNDENALLVLNYSAKMPIFAKYNIDTKSLQPLIEATENHGHLTPTNDILLVSLNKISKLLKTKTADNRNTDELLEVKGNIINSIMKKNKLYLHVKTLNDNSLWSLSLNDYSFKMEKTLPDNIYAVWDLNVANDLLLTETISIEKDIIQLEKGSK
jgi:transcriptional activator of cad operon